MTDHSQISCLWCETSFEPRATGGKPQRFCRTDCRIEFHKAARLWAIEAVEDGDLSVAQLKKGRRATYTLDTAQIITFPVPKVRKSENTLSESNTVEGA